MPRHKKKPTSPTPNSRQNGCYVASRPCGCKIATCYDYRDKETGKTVAEWIAEGLIINHITWAEFQAIVQDAKTYTCPHAARERNGE
jgi:hypothetical protein